MGETVLKVENLSKQYRLGEVGTGTISHDLNRWWHRVRGKEDPYLKVGESNDRTSKGQSAYTWALRDINFEVEQGSVLGIIGKNGAGKSTLLKILSKVTGPTTGTIKSRGRIASLLEVGTGFHPELTGRENIYLNGTIMGMTRKEVSKKLDEIVEFAGVARYLDTPVKRYSSGMMVRLGFSVAAHLEPEILIVDEVLAVGDAEFQKKCIGKMGDVAKGGRTILFVSHNMAVMQSLCKRGILLENGKIKHQDDIGTCVDAYLSNFASTSCSSVYNNEASSNSCYFKKIEVKPTKSHVFMMGNPLELDFEIYSEFQFDNLQICIIIFDVKGVLVTTLYNTDFNIKCNLNRGLNIFRFRLDAHNLCEGDYSLSFKAMYNYGIETFDSVKDAIAVSIEPVDLMNSGRPFLSDRGHVWFNLESLK